MHLYDNVLEVIIKCISNLQCRLKRFSAFGTSKSCVPMSTNLYQIAYVYFSNKKVKTDVPFIFLPDLICIEINNVKPFSAFSLQLLLKKCFVMQKM